MKIGIDACCWSNRRGFGRFTRELLRSLVAIDSQNEYLFFVDQQTAVSHSFPHGVEMVTVPTRVAPTTAASASSHRSLSDLWAMSRHVWKTPVDLFFFPAVYSYFPLMNRTKVIVTIHDIIADRFPDKIFPSRRQMWFWKIKQSLAIKQADVILTVSQHSKTEIVNYFNLPERRLRVISEAADPVFRILERDGAMQKVLQGHGIGEGARFLMGVGGISPHKNWGALIHAFQKIQTDPAFSDLKLILAGDHQTDSFYSDYKNLKALVERLQLSQKVIFTGFLEDPELAYFYNSASLVVLPSLHEGFGLPAVESMACGTPVVASNAGSFPEVIGDAGLFFDPNSPEQILETVRKVLLDRPLSEEMRRRGLDRAKQFSWRKASTDLLTVFQELADTDN